MHQNSKNTLCRELDETINYKVIEYCKLSQKQHNTRHDRVGKVIHWEMCKRMKFDHTTKYMHKPESILENDTRKILRNFVIQTDHHILAED